MKNLKIKAKLLFGFVAVSVLTIIVGVVGTVGLKSTDIKYRELIKISTTGNSSIADVRELFQMQRLAIRTLVIDINDPAQIQADIDGLKESEAKMADAMAVYESTITDPASEQKYYMAKDAYLTGYSAVKQKIIDAAQSGDYDKALEALAEAAKAARPVTEGLQGTVDYINELIEQDLADMSSHSQRNIIIQVVVMGLASVCAMTLGMYIASLISKPIKIMSDFFVRFGSTGDLTLSEEDKKNIMTQSLIHDETGQCISAAVTMVSRLTEINEKLSKLAGGDLTVDMRALSEKDGLGLAVIKMIDSLNTIFGELHASAGQVSTGSEQIAQGAQELASGSSQQAASIEEFVNSLDALQEKTGRNAENSTNAAKVNEKISSMIEESVYSMSQMLGAMKEIDESSKSITRVIKVIDDIAFQTNILALNAAVEAARAGQHGKGFAVVADEVRNLASKSAAAAKETAALIEGSSEKVKEGNQIVNKTNSSLESVAEGSREVVRLIAEVSAGSTEQANAINEIHQNIGQISNVVQENSASAEESAAASEQMSSQAAMLNEIVSRFKMRPAETAISVYTADKMSATGKAAANSPQNAVKRHEKY